MKTEIDTYRKVACLLEQGRTQREIASRCGVSTKTIVKINNKMKKHMMSGAVIQEMSVEQLTALFFPKKTGVTRKGLVLPGKEFIRQKILLEGKNKREAWREYSDTYCGKTMGYTQFCTYINDHEEELQLKPVFRPGDIMMVSWCSQNVTIIDRNNGVTKEYPVIIGVWPFSGTIFMTCVESKDFESWLDGCVILLHSAKCVPHKIIPLSYRGIFGKGNQLQEQLLLFAKYYGCEINTYVQRELKDLAGIADEVVKRTLDDQYYFEIEEANGMLSIPSITNEAFSSYELFQNRELAAGYPIPAREYEVIRWRQAKVQYMSHISISRKYYSVPWQYIGKTVDVKLSRNYVEIFYEKKQIALHLRLYGDKEWYATVPEHMPPEGADVYWNREQFLSRARKIGPATYKVIQINLNMKPIEQQMYFDCRMILMLTDKYSSALLEKACSIIVNNRIIPWKNNVIKKLEELTTPAH